ncbi:sensor domain-containing diguanylate cyclase [Curvibacter sp. CHRR-16]|uniref:sensor domain-containing diguanylate cyclase n=1 Tax=Curvibacter sp. CHRR-16 TaxID=2835872 RepID=UPI001BDA80F4|nr:sensor domain-containing diguanylate cyclase [Curvibacter sp. CHRR-16]MBT0570808.1 sensor domain-containing diguanylate cyclase [Curvibacter sp. CHRR-16]
MSEEDLYRNRLQLALEASGLDLWENNLSTGEVTQRVTRIFAELGYNEQDRLDYMDDVFSLVHPDDVEAVKEAIERHMAGETTVYRSECRMRSRQGEWVWYANFGKIVEVSADRLETRFIGVTFNIDARKRHEAELAELNQRLVEQNEMLRSMNHELQVLASTDALTGLANRRVLIEAGERETLRSVGQGQCLSLLVIDLDRFKQINDSWGHPVGDAVLCAVAELCSSRFRRGHDVVARLGGEEFAVLMPTTPYAEAMHMAEALRQSVEQQQIGIGNGLTVSCTASIGVSTLSVDDLQDALELPLMGFGDLLLCADRALYQAKDAGRNQVLGNLVGLSNPL